MEEKIDNIELEILINILTKVFENKSREFTKSETEVAGTILIKIGYNII